MSDHNSIVTNVNVAGVALADYDLAQFTVVVQSEGKTGPEAKEKLGKAVHALDEMIRVLTEKDGVKIEAETRKGGTRTAPNRVWNDKKEKQETRGYTATYTLNFTVTNVDLVSVAHDRLSSLPIDGLAVEEPEFKVRNLDGLHKEALKNAFARASVRFANECDVLGKVHQNYEVSAWSVRYDESQGRRRDHAESRGYAMAQAAPMAKTLGGGSPIKIEAGEAEVVANLNVTFSHKR
jgi:uncharacterized protein YggE